MSYVTGVNSLRHTYLCVSILNADIHSNHEENSNRDTEISNQTTDLMRQRAKDIPWQIFHLEYFRLHYYFQNYTNVEG